jgi:hypothetical protein
MVLVPADAADVVPSRRLMAHVTLTDLRVWPACYSHRDHVKVHHIVARRGLMTLGAIRGTRRRVAKLWYRPAIGGMTLPAVLPKQGKMSILNRMACGAVEDRFGGRDALVGQ